MSARRRKTRRKLAPMLESLIEALEGQDADHRSGAAGALRAFGHLAALEIPNRGAFAPHDPDLYSAIEAIADKHLGFREPRKEFSDSTMEIEDPELRERIQSTANHMQTISDQAYFYSGLAFGITFSRFGWPW
jgi:hypothetical protein